MTGRTLVVAIVGSGCIAAAGVGGFLATRMAAPAQAALDAPVSADAALAVDVRASADPAAAEAAAVIEAPPAVAPARVEPPAAPRAAAPPDSPPAPARPAPVPPPPAVEPPVEVPPVVTAVEPTTALPVARALPGIPAPPPPEPAFDEFVIEADSVMGLLLEDDVSSETAQIEDRVLAMVSRDVVVDGRTVVPAGTLVEGHVTGVEPGGRFRDKARLELRFTTLMLSERDRLRMLTEPIVREGDSPTDEAASKIGAGAVIGTILGAVIGGKRGAAVGGAAGAAGGTAAVAASGRNAASLAAGTPLTVRLVEPVVLRIPRERR